MVFFFKLYKNNNKITADVFLNDINQEWCEEARGEKSYLVAGNTEPFFFFFLVSWSVPAFSDGRNAECQGVRINPV